MAPLSPTALLAGGPACDWRQEEGFCGKFSAQRPILGGALSRQQLVARGSDPAAEWQERRVVALRWRVVSERVEGGALFLCGSATPWPLGADGGIVQLS